jgi:hypothetical protein
MAKTTDANKVKDKLDKADAALKIAAEAATKALAQMPLLRSMLDPIVRKADMMEQFIKGAESSLATARSGYKTFEQDKVKLADLQKFTIQLTDEMMDLQKALKKKPDAKMQKELDLKEKALEKNSMLVNKLDATLGERVSNIENLSEYFMSSIIRPVLEYATELNKLSKQLGTHLKTLNEWEEKAFNKEFQDRLSKCADLMGNV